MTYEEAAAELGYHDTRGVHACIRTGALQKDGNGGVTDESVKAYKAKRQTSVKQKEPETKGFTVEEEPTNQTTVKEMFDLLPDWEDETIDLSQYAKDARGTITLGALMEFGKACIEAHEKRKGLKAVAFEVAREVA